MLKAHVCLGQFLPTSNFQSCHISAHYGDSRGRPVISIVCTTVFKEHFSKFLTKPDPHQKTCSLQTCLCPFQCSFWHSLEQYSVKRHPAHFFAGVFGISQHCSHLTLIEGTKLVKLPMPLVCLFSCAWLLFIHCIVGTMSISVACTPCTKQNQDYHFAQLMHQC